MKNARKPGYYRVKYEGDWTIAYCNGKEFVMTGTDQWDIPDSFSEIIETPISPEPPQMTRDDVYGTWQLCPKCNGQGIVSKPPYIPGDINEWTSSETSYVCDLCNGKKIIYIPSQSIKGVTDEEINGYLEEKCSFKGVTNEMMKTFITLQRGAILDFVEWMRSKLQGK